MLCAVLSLSASRSVISHLFRVFRAAQVVESPRRTMHGDARRALRALIEAAAEGAAKETSETQIGKTHTSRSSPKAALPQPSTPPPKAAAPPPTAAAPPPASPSLPDASPSRRTVLDLRPRPGVRLSAGSSIAEAVQQLSAANADAGLVLKADGTLEGILTSSDVATKLVAEGRAPEAMLVREAMTVEPRCVATGESAVDAVATMMAHRFRHLPVLDEAGTVVGLLDIAKCLYDAMTAVDRMQARTLSSPTLAYLLEAQTTTNATNGGTNATNGGGKRVGLIEVPAAISAEASVAKAAALMARGRSAVLVEAPGGRCVGILTARDVMLRVVGKGLAAASTPVALVMTASPDVMPGSATALQALHQMQVGGYRSVPVVSDAGEPLGVLDVLTLLHGATTTPAASPAASHAASPVSRCPAAPPPAARHPAPSELPLSGAAEAATGDIQRRMNGAPPLPCQPPEGWATCEDGGFVRVRGSDGGPVAAAAPPRGTPTASQLEQLEALVSRLETAAAGPPVRATLQRAWRRVLALTPCAVAGVAVTLAGFGIDRLCYGRCSLARAYCRPHPTAPPAPSVPSVPSASASASASASLPASPSPPPHLHPALT